MLKNIKEERLERLLLKKSFDPKYNLELMEFLEKHTKNRDIKNAIQYINSIKYTHPGLNSQEYITHPLRVAKIIYEIDQNIDIDILIIALLHNILEVSDVRKEHLILEFNSQIVDSLTILKVNRKLEKDLNYKKEYYQKIYEKKETSIVKAIDKLDNIFLLCLHDNAELREWYLKEIEEHVFPLVKKYLPSLLVYFKSLVQDAREIGFLNSQNSIELYGFDYK